MLAAAEELRFEYAARLRDELRELRRDLREIQLQRGAGRVRRSRHDRRRRVPRMPLSVRLRRPRHGPRMPAVDSTVAIERQ